MMNRRHLLAGLATLPFLPNIGLADAPTDSRLLLVLLRGGLDGLVAVPPLGDRDFRHARPDSPGRLLDARFGLHPALEPLRKWWEAKDLALIHGVGVHGGDRSHFDAQDVLDNGTDRAQSTRTGWLNRAVSELGSRPYALDRNVPLILHGPQGIGALDPTHPVVFPKGHDAALTQLWAADPDLSAALERGLESQALLGRIQPDRVRSRGSLDPTTARTIGALLAHPEGPRVAVLEAGGWDTHTNQARVLDRQLDGLAKGLLAVRQGLAEAWRETTIIVVSEFGRRVELNGTGGTDHGTGGLALLAGGAVNGGRSFGAWPGLAERDRFEGRDLQITTDVRTMFMGVLQARFGVRDLGSVFPGTEDLVALTEAFRS